jgi:endonuclease/exonuclease/phosphatase family metal-dependent hydrolase
MQAVKDEAIEEVSVMTWNILRDEWAKGEHSSWNEREPNATSILGDHLPDLVGLQEETKDQVESITRALPSYSYLTPHHSHGGGLLIRKESWVVIESGKIQIPRGREASWAKLESSRSRQPWLFYNAHLMHRKAENSAADRMEAVKAIGEHVLRHAPHGIPVVMTGDFNSLHDEPALRYLTGDIESPVMFSNSFNLIHGANDARGTFRGLSIEHQCDRIDHILINNHVIVNVAEIINYDELQAPYPSDHYPVIAKLRINLIKTSN